MHEFPPHDLQAFLFHLDWWWIGGDLVVLLVGLSCTLLVLRRNRKTHFYDSAILVVIAFPQLLFFASQLNRTNSELVTLAFCCSGFVIVSLITAFTLVYQRLEKESDREGSRLCIFTFGITGILMVAMSVPVLLPRNGPRVDAPAPCRKKMVHIGVALFNYYDEHEHFPLSKTGSPPHSWRVDFLPFLDQEALFNRYDFYAQWNAGGNDEIAQTKVAAFKCPDDRSPEALNRYPTTSYAAVTGENTMWPDSPITFEQVTDGSTVTIAMVEACGRNIPWAEPRDVDISNTKVGVNLPGALRYTSDGVISSYHPGNAAVLFADGGARYISETIDKKVLQNLLTRNDGEDISWEDF